MSARRPVGRRTVRRLLASHAAASLAIALPWPLLLVLVWEQVGETPVGPLLLGLTGAARMLPYVLCSWATGTLGDRFRRDLVLRATLVSRIVLLVVVALAVAQGWLLVAVCAASAAVMCGTPAYPLLAASLPQLAGPDLRRATDTLVTIEVAAFVVGPAVGGLLLAGPDRGGALALAVVLGVVGLLAVRGVSIPAPEHGPEGAATVRQVFSVVRRTPIVFSAVAVVALLNFADGATSLALLPMSEEAWGTSAGGFGIAAAWLGFGALGAPLLWWVPGSPVFRRRCGLGVMAGALVVVAISPELLWALVPLAVVGLATVFVECSVTETIQVGVPDLHRAGVLGLADSVMVAAAMVGSLVTPALADLVGPRALIAMLAGVVVAAVAVPAGRLVLGVSPGTLNPARRSGVSRVGGADG